MRSSEIPRYPDALGFGLRALAIQCGPANPGAWFAAFEVWSERYGRIVASGAVSRKGGPAVTWAADLAPAEKAAVVQWALEDVRYRLPSLPESDSTPAS